MLRVRHLIAAAICALALSGTAAAQSLRGIPGSTSIEGYLSRYHLADADARLRLDAAGARLLWRLDALLGARESSFAARTRVGGFFAASEALTSGVRALHYGAQADYHPVAAPLRGWIDPIVSLGVGAFRTEREERTSGSLSPLPLTGDPLPRLLTAETRERTETSLALTPALGVRLLVTPAFGFRADVRDLVRVGDRTRHDLEVAGGISVNF